MKKFSLLLMILLISLPISAQDKKGFDVEFGANLVSRHIWRGLLIGQTPTSPAVPHIQPGAVLEYNFGKSGNINLGFVGTYGISNEYSESDFYLSYTLPTQFGSFTAQIFDYHYPFKGIGFANFDNDGLGAHTLEASLRYTGTEEFPLGVFISNNFHNVLPDDNTFYSELNYIFDLTEVYLTLFIGGAMGDSRWHVVSSDGFEITNLGFTAYRLIKLSETVSFPVRATWTYNPHLEKSYIAFGISI